MTEFRDPEPHANIEGASVKLENMILASGKAGKLLEEENHPDDKHVVLKAIGDIDAFIEGKP